MASCKNNVRAETFKNEGNVLFQQGKYQAAYRKYTDAIKDDPTNAIYYSNRAACSLGLKEYMDASRDARKATELDPKFSKAWGRLGTAKGCLAAWNSSIEAFKEALACLPPQDKLSEADQRLKTQFLEGIEKAEKGIQEAQNIDMKAVSKDDKSQLPWFRAGAMLEQLKAEKKISSAFVVVFAYEEFKKGVDTMKGLKKEPTPTGQMAMFGKPDAIVDITNGLMRDPRVFHLDCGDWFEKYNNQMIFESQMFHAWKDGGAKQVKEEAPKRLKKDGWPSTRVALSTTIRAWIMGGIFATATQRYLAAVEYHSRVMDILEWGSRVWQGVSNKDRGCIFERTFIRGAKRLHITAIHEALATKTGGCSYDKKTLAELCRDLIAETDAHPPEDVGLDIGFLLSFWTYPKGEALAILGWCHMQRGFVAADAQTACSAFLQAAESYVESCKTFPQDDEKVAAYLAVALEGYWFANKPLEDTLFLMIWMQKATATMGQIWEHSPVSASLDPRLRQFLFFQLRCIKAKTEGLCSEESIVKPHFIKAQDKWPAPNTIYL